MTMFAVADNSAISLMPSIEKGSYTKHPRVVSQLPRLQANFFGNITPEWIFVRPFPVYFELDEDRTYIVSDEIFLVYGNGENRSEAIDDYISSLIEFYKILEEGSKTNQFDQLQFNNLRAYFQQIHRG